MKTQRHTASTGDTTRSDGRAAGLIALMLVLIVAVCASAAVLLTVPQAFEAVASAAAPSNELAGPDQAERTFHERHPMNAVDHAVDTPTF